MSGTQNRLLSPETQPTVTVVGFVLAMIALAVSVTAVIRVRDATDFAAGLHQVGGANTDDKVGALETRIQALEQKIQQLESRPAPAAMPPADGAPVAEGKAGKAGKAQ